MSRSVSRSISGDRLTRRDAIGRFTSVGAAAILAATYPARTRGTVTAASRPSAHVPSKGFAMNQSSPVAETSIPTVVLVHGAFADSSSWNAVVPDLLAQGYPVIAAANPLRSVEIDAAYVANLVAAITGPVILVGHSYGGIVISTAAAGLENVKALVFVAAFAPEAGENAVQLSGQFPGSTLGPTLAPLPLPDGSVDLSIKPDEFWQQFAADLPEEQAALMAVAQRPVTEAALTDGAGEPAWKSIPSWFVYAEQDKNIPAAVEVFMAERAGAVKTVEVPGASHVVMLSQPQAVIDVIKDAIEATTMAGAEQV